MNKNDKATNQFKKALKLVFRQLKRNEISLFEFIEALKGANIKFYSKDEIKKISKLFEGLKKIPISIPFSHLDLVCMQIAYNIKYYIVRCSNQSKPLCLYNGQKAKEHDTKKCLQIFKKIMYRHYGSHMNWFRVLGGLTVSVSSNLEIFISNISKILKNTQHSQCSERLAKLFLQNKQSRQIHWQYFTKIIKENISVDKDKKELEEKVQHHSLDFKTNRHNSRLIYSKTEQLPSSLNQSAEILYQDNYVVSLDHKKCTLHKRQNKNFSLTSHASSWKRYGTQSKQKRQANITDSFKKQEKGNSYYSLRSKKPKVFDLQKNATQQLPLRNVHIRHILQ